MIAVVEDQEQGYMYVYHCWLELCLLQGYICKNELSLALKILNLTCTVMNLCERSGAQTQDRACTLSIM